MDRRRPTRFELRRSRESQRAYRRERKTDSSPPPCRAWGSRATDLASESAAANSGRRYTPAANRQEKARYVPTRTSLSRSPPLNPPPTGTARLASTKKGAPNPRLRHQTSELQSESRRKAPSSRDGDFSCPPTSFRRRTARPMDWSEVRRTRPQIWIDLVALSLPQRTRRLLRSGDG